MYNLPPMPSIFKSAPKEIHITEKQAKTIKNIRIFDDEVIMGNCITYRYISPDKDILNSESKSWTFNKTTHQLVAFSHILQITLPEFDKNFSILTKRYGLPYRINSDERTKKPYLQQWSVRQNPNLKKDQLYTIELRYFTYGSMTAFTLNFLDEEQVCKKK